MLEGRISDCMRRNRDSNTFSVDCKTRVHRLLQDGYWTVKFIFMVIGAAVGAFIDLMNREE